MIGRCRLRPLDELEHAAAARAAHSVEELFQGLADGVADHPVSVTVALHPPIQQPSQDRPDVA